MPEYTVYLGLGSNLGDREKNLREAIHRVGSHPRVRVLKVSTFYETDPVGYLEQGRFINGALSCKTSLDPYQLLDFLQGIERDLKRVKSIRWGPRTIDLDILLYGSLELEDQERLIIPHPRLREREFVLVPLAEIGPGAVHPPTGKNITTLLSELQGDK